MHVRPARASLLLCALGLEGAERRLLNAFVRDGNVLACFVVPARHASQTCSVSRVYIVPRKDAADACLRALLVQMSLENS